jgi:hypothetical protein
MDAAVGEGTMTTRTNLSRRFRTLQQLAAALLFSASLMGCAGARYGLESPSAPAGQVDAKAMELRVADVRQLNPADQRIEAPARIKSGSTVKAPVNLPKGFRLAAAERLKDIADGSGSTVEVVAEVEQANVIWSADAEGTTAKVHVTITFSVYDENGGLMQRGTESATGELDGEDAEPTELAAAVEATALNAFDQYWAREKTVVGLNQALGGRG